MRTVRYIITSLLLFPFIAPAQVVINNTYIKLNGGTGGNPIILVVTNSNPALGITNTNGWIISEDEFNMVQWNIGTATGTYVVPFGYSTANYIPLSYRVSNAGTGAGVVKFATYHTAALNSADEPSDVTNLTPFILPGDPSNTDDSYKIVDRFYTVDDSLYTTVPTVGNITFSYISNAANAEVAAPNNITQSRLLAQRFNANTQTWNDWFGAGCTDAIVGNVGTVQTGPVLPADMHRSWALWDDSMPLPIIITTNNISCNDNAATATAYGGLTPYTYTWAPTPGSSASISGLTAGTYTVSVRDGNACASSASSVITAPPPLIASTSSLNDVTCNGGSNGSASTSVSGGTPLYTYSWSPMGGANSATSGLSASTYTVTITDDKGCITHDTISITQPPAITDLVSPTNSTCGKDNGSAMAAGSGGTGTLNYSWEPSGINNAVASGLAAGNYTVTITDANGCTETAATTINDIGAPTNTACCSSTIIIGQSAMMEVTQEKGDQFKWDPTATLSCDTCINPTATPTVTTWYHVTITDSVGCSLTDSLLITVNENCGPIYLPTAFSPNGDGWNDILYVMGNCIKEMDLIIYDRWGNKVFESTNPINGWDGTYKGQPMNTGTYVFSLEVTDMNNNLISRKGNVTLIR